MLKKRDITVVSISICLFVAGSIFLATDRVYYESQRRAQITFHGKQTIRCSTEIQVDRLSRYFAWRPRNHISRNKKQTVLVLRAIIVENHGSWSLGESRFRRTKTAIWPSREKLSYMAYENGPSIYPIYSQGIFFSKEM